MAYVNGTTHYNLPQTVGTDKRDWADTNQAFADVDAALFGAVDDVAQAQTEIDALTGRMNTAEENISDNTADIAGLDTRLTTAEGAITSQQSQITDLRQDTEDMICAYNEASATSTHAYEIGDYFIYNDVLYKATQAIAIGDTIVPDTNCATTNVTTELLATEDLSGDVQQLQTDVGQLQTDVGNLKDKVDVVETFSDKASLITYLNGLTDNERRRSVVIDETTDWVFNCGHSSNSSWEYISFQIQSSQNRTLFRQIMSDSQYLDLIVPFTGTATVSSYGGADHAYTVITG